MTSDDITASGVADVLFCRVGRCIIIGTSASSSTIPLRKRNRADDLEFRREPETPRKKKNEQFSEFLTKRTRHGRKNKREKPW